MPDGGLGILNVGAGDIKISFDNTNVAETIRANRMVTEMLQRGYALLVRVPGKKGKEPTYARVLKFDERTSEYIIADYDPTVVPPGEKNAQDKAEQGAKAEAPTGPTESPRPTTKRTTRIKARDTHGVAVARTAGG